MKNIQHWEKQYIPWRMYRKEGGSTCHGEKHCPWSPKDVGSNLAVPHYSSEASGKKQTFLCLSFFICEIEIMLLNINRILMLA